MPRVAPGDRLLFFGDCHLAAEHPQRMAHVVSFLDDVCAGAARVICVGDLFDYWLGPDHVQAPEFAPVLDALSRLVGRGVRVDLIHGNRDFHVGKAFTRRTGVTVRRTHRELSLPDGRTAHVTHGDLLCSADVRYHKMRRLIRSYTLRRLFRRMPPAWRIDIARRMRGASKKEVAAKSDRVLGIVPGTVAGLMGRGADVVICGHVHRKAETRYQLPDGREGVLYTLGDWDAEGGSYLEWRDGRFEMRDVRAHLDSNPA